MIVSAVGMESIISSKVMVGTGAYFVVSNFLISNVISVCDI